MPGGSSPTGTAAPLRGDDPKADCLGRGEGNGKERPRLLPRNYLFKWLAAVDLRVVLHIHPEEWALT